MQIAASNLKDVYVSRMSELPLALAKRGVNVTTSVDSIEDAASLRLWEQGDESMYELDNLNMRFSNRHDSAVLKALQSWWDCAQKQRAALLSQQLVVVNAATQAAARAVQTLPKIAYHAMYIRICKVLLEDEGGWDYPEAVRLADESWVSDTKGSGMLTRTGFMNSLFELVCCTRSVDAVPSRYRYCVHLCVQSVPGARADTVPSRPTPACRQTCGQ
jgi:hypothetical protein